MTFEEVFAYKVLLGTIPWILFLAWVKLKYDRPKKVFPKWPNVPLPEGGGGTGAMIGSVPPTPAQKRQAWREWVEKDGTREGLLAYLETWRDVSFPKPKKPVESLVESLQDLGLIVDVDKVNPKDGRPVYLNGGWGWDRNLYDVTITDPLTPDGSAWARCKLFVHDGELRVCRNDIALNGADSETVKIAILKYVESQVRPKYVAGVDVANPNGGFTVLQRGAKFDYVVKSDGEMDRLLAGGHGAIMRFFERNEEKLKTAISNPTDNSRTKLKWVPGQWVRIYGQLALITAASYASIHYKIYRGGGIHSTDSKEIEAALPKNGEWWRWTRKTCPERVCEHVNPPGQACFIVTNWLYEGLHEATVGYEVACGCLVPFNFGLGEEAKG